MKEFRLAANSRGGSFEPDPTINVVHATLDDYLNQFHRFAEGLNEEFRPRGGKGVNVQVGYVLNPNANAFARRINDVDIIGIYLGTFFRIQNAAWVLSKAMNDIASLKDLDNISKSIDKVPYEINLNSEISGNGHVKGTDADYDRVYVNHMVKVAMEFIFHHELAHIWNGHVDLMVSQGQLDSIDEMPDSSEFSRLRHMLEIDADQKAVLVTLTNSLEVNEIDRSFKFPEGIEISDYIGIIFTGIYLSFRLLYHSDREFLPIINSLTHPPSVYRLSWAILQMCQFFYKFLGLHPSSTRKAIEEIYPILEHVFSVSHDSKGIYAMHPEFWVESLRVRGIFSRYYMEVRSMLEPHKRGVQLPGVETYDVADFL